MSLFVFQLGQPAQTVMNAATKAFANVLSEAAKSTKPKGFMGLLSDNSITLRNLLFSAVVVGLELLLNSQLFDCPLKNHVFYGTTFLVAPFFIVFITNVLLVGEVWKVTNRCCVEQYRRCGECCFWVCPNVFKALIGPCVWLIASFADTEYYVCAAVGQDVDKRNLTNATEIEYLEAEFAQAKSTSHILAWFFFSLMVTGTAIVMCTKKCCLKGNVLLEGKSCFVSTICFIFAKKPTRSYLYGQISFFLSLFFYVEKLSIPQESECNSNLAGFKISCTGKVKFKKISHFYIPTFIHVFLSLSFGFCSIFVFHCSSIVSNYGKLW